MPRQEFDGAEDVPLELSPLTTAIGIIKELSCVEVIESYQFIVYNGMYSICLDALQTRAIWPLVC